MKLWNFVIKSAEIYSKNPKYKKGIEKTLNFVYDIWKKKKKIRIKAATVKKLINTYVNERKSINQIMEKVQKKKE